MNQKTKLVIVIFLTSFAMNAQNWGNGEKVIGNGKMVTVNRTTSDYDDISVGGSFDVILIKGKEGNIVIEGEENIIPYIETEMQGKKLQIRYKKNTNISTTKKLVVKVPYNKIDKISLGGSGNITNEGIIKSIEFSASLGGSGNITLKIESDEINANIGGSGNIELTGKTKELTCSIAGSGNINAYDLTADTTNATIAGSGSVKTTVSTKISAKVVGSGNIYYKGNPTYTDLKSVGSGDIINKN